MQAPEVTEPTAQTPANALEKVAGVALESVPDVAENRRNYNRLVRQARLVSLLLEKIDFKISPGAVGINRALLSRDLGAKATVLTNGIEDGTCVASIGWSINLRYKKKSIAKCGATYVITYEGMKGCTEEAVSLFIGNVAKTATYAYFRALYAHLDWSANLSSPPLPIMQFQPKV